MVTKAFNTQSWALCIDSVKILGNELFGQSAQSSTNVNVCEQRSPAVTLCPLCGDTLSRNVALSELRRDNGSPAPSWPPAPHMSLVSSPLLRPQLSFPPPPPGPGTGHL